MMGMVKGLFTKSGDARINQWLRCTFCIFVLERNTFQITSEKFEDLHLIDQRFSFLALNHKKKKFYRFSVNSVTLLLKSIMRNNIKSIFWISAGICCQKIHRRGSGGWKEMWSRCSLNAMLDSTFNAMIELLLDLRGWKISFDCFLINMLWFSLLSCQWKAWPQQ